MTPIPPDFAAFMHELYGTRGDAWLDRLPAIIEACARRWSLTVSPPFPELSYNYVAPAVQANGRSLVLKIGVPNRELLTEIAALRHYDGRGIVQLLDADPEQGALLLERLHPGTMLSALADDDAATAVAADLMKQLWRTPPPEHDFPTVADWAGGLARLRRTFEDGSGPFPSDLVSTAESLFAELLPSMAAPVLLHGDLHHYNILAAERRPWLALDPKGVVGEPAYEVGALLRNPVPEVASWPDLGHRLARRVDILAERLELDRQRLIGWGMAQAVLSAWWSFEDTGASQEQVWFPIAIQLRQML